MIGFLGLVRLSKPTLSRPQGVAPVSGSSARRCESRAFASRSLYVASKSRQSHLRYTDKDMQRTLWVIAGVLELLLLHAAILWYMGQPLMYEGGYIKLWHGVVVSPENSQHLTDWYTLSHVIHGILFYAALAFLFPRWPVGIRLLVALGVEISWELFENTDMIINRYREQALAQGYFGDSIVNSVGDVAAIIIGFFAAWRLPAWAAVALIIALELIALYIIRDSLTLNIIQLIHPVEQIGNWQAS